MCHHTHEAITGLTSLMPPPPSNAQQNVVNQLLAEKELGSHLVDENARAHEEQVRLPAEHAGHDLPRLAGQLAEDLCW